MASSTSSNLYNEGKNLASHARDAIRESAGDARENLQHMSENARELAHDKLNEMRSSGRERAHQLEEIIQEDPLKAILIAAGVGLLCGILLRK